MVNWPLSARAWATLLCSALGTLEYSSPACMAPSTMSAPRSRAFFALAIMTSGSSMSTCQAASGSSPFSP